MGISRISTLSSNTHIATQLLKLQAQLHEKGTQISSGKVSQDYKGIGINVERLINMENSTRLLDRYMTGNTIANIRIQIQQSVISGIREEGETAPSGGIRGLIKDFRNQLISLKDGAHSMIGKDDSFDTSDTETRITNLQNYAFNAMVSIEQFLNEDVNGQFVFGGSRTQTPPTNLGLAAGISGFQDTYDGDATLYPWNRDAHVDTSLTTATADTGDLTFDADADTITAGVAGSLSSIPVGAKIDISAGADANNQGPYTVISNDGTTIRVAGTYNASAADGGTASITSYGDIGTTQTAPATITVNSYYQGNREPLTHRFSKTQSVAMDLNAADAAFEKTIRALGIIAQGAWDDGSGNVGDGGPSTAPPTRGSLAWHPERLDEALWLLDAALEINTSSTPPYGTADQTGANRSNIGQVEQKVGRWQVLIHSSNERHQELINFYSVQITDIENIDPLEATTNLLSDKRALEVSYQALSTIMDLSLHKFL